MAKTEPFDNHIEKYEKWFKENHYAYLSEVEAIRHFIPYNKKGIEIGIGTGRFAVPFNIREGIEPSAVMRDYSRRLGITVYNGTAEKLPLEDNSYDFALMVTTICFFDDVLKAFHETRRILRPGGSIIVGIIDKNSPLGQFLENEKNSNVFYKDATFYSVAEACDLLERSKFNNIEVIQTIFGDVSLIRTLQMYKKSYGEGGFVVIKASKSSTLI